MDDLLEARRLRYFMAVLEHGSVRGAADHLDMDPSALSRAIAALENQCGTRLFQRHGRGVATTEAGQMLAAYARRQQHQKRQLLAHLESIEKIERGHVDIVAGEGFADWLMRHSLRDFMASHPQITIDLEIAGTDEIVRRIADERAQIGVLFQPPANDQLRSHLSMSQPIQALVLPDHPLTRLGRPLRLSDLQPYPGATLRRGFGMRQHIEAAEISEGVRLNTLLTTTSFHAIGHFVVAGLGYALSTRPALAVEGTELVALPMRNPILHQGLMHIVSKHGRMLSPAATELVGRMVRDIRATPGIGF
ncbi:LysR family transcriptional regulator [Pseudoxanthomonas winnipegensis]|uniref:LysR family transcriptional regulator n=1 Tax=Pseudoxanthomonas winnipegensis TaxID=2480810 RepID=A0A4Q8M165_9GAMM|nr:LysR family transcriptional regulator [Pseudoxanthomonas winnipegensis]TAA39618.1 LysR family transcriptional regulator [Pseudoxanthomonas winnipegensis]